MVHIQISLHGKVAEPGGTGAICAAALNSIAQLARHREGHRDLAHLSVQHLKDIGLTRTDVQSVISAPLSVDVATELSIRANGRSANWWWRN